MNVSQLKQQLAEKMGEDAHHLEGRDKAFLAELAGIPADQIEDDPKVTGEGETGWIEEFDQPSQEDSADRMRRHAKEQEAIQHQRTIERGDLGGAYRMAAALARNGGKV